MDSVSEEAFFGWDSHKLSCRSMPAEWAQEREDLWACCLPTKLPFQTLREVQQAAGESACSNLAWALPAWSNTSTCKPHVVTGAMAILASLPSISYLVWHAASQGGSVTGASAASVKRQTHRCLVRILPECRHAGH